MDLKVSSPRTSLSPTDCVSDPEEKEISDDDDDDRNHKHRRREARSQSLEGDALDQVLPRPYRKRNKPFEDGHHVREGNSQCDGTWKNCNITNQEKEFSGRFDKRRQNVASFSRSTLDSSQRMRGNQLISADLAPIRSKGRESGWWGQRDSRLSSVDIASQLVQQGSVPPNLFAGRALPNVSSIPNASWNGFGLVPAIPNGGLDNLHPIGLQGTLRPSIIPPMNLGIPRQRCRDFEERGFCLRGDMCPMEHGVNRIVVDDVQSLSQFNLPVTLPGAPMLATHAGQGPLVASASSGTLINSKGLHNKSSKPGTSNDGVGLNGAFIGSSVAGAADLYDPDQPLWVNDCPETSSALLALNPSNSDDTGPLLDSDLSNRNHVVRSDGSEYERPIKNAGTAKGSQSSSIWGQTDNLKNRLEIRDKIDSTFTSSNYLDRETKKNMELTNGAHGIPRQGRRLNVDAVGTQVIGSSSKPRGDSGRNIRKPFQKALRTLFVSGIPLKENKREALLSHFQKFGEVIDIYIPLNSERAFVQFSKREEAEAAFKAPDAVMGNRFIKLWWANRDSITEDGINGASNMLVNSQVTTPLAPPYSIGIGIEISGPKDDATHASVIPSPASDHPKPVVSSVPKAPAPSQKKLEDLELMKEQLRKKQEMLDQKRNEFKRQLNKLQKQSIGLKDEVACDQPSKKQKGETAVDDAKAEISRSSDSGAVVSPRRAETTSDSFRSAVTPSSKSYSAVKMPEFSSLKSSIRPLAPLGAHFINRFKLDNRPTAFKVLPPLPHGLTNVSALKEHFFSYGDLSFVELEGFEPQDSNDESEASRISACISFKTRHSAEKAFLHGKCWQGQNLQFMWLTSSKDNAAKENRPASYKESSDATIQSAGEVAATGSQTVADLENGEPENLESKENSMNVDRDKDLQSSSSKISGGEQSP